MPVNPSIYRCLAGALVAFARSALERLVYLAVARKATAQQIVKPEGQLFHVSEIGGRFDGDDVVDALRGHDLPTLGAYLAQRILFELGIAHQSPLFRVIDPLFVLLLTHDYNVFGLPIPTEWPWLMRFQPIQYGVIVCLGFCHGMIYKRLIVRYHDACPPNH